MLPVEKVADLTLEEPAGSSGSRHIAAASGLAMLGDTIYVIADDEAYLAVFRDMARSEGTTVGLLDIELPDDAAERKRNKPDLESLTLLPPFGSYEHGALIALGSASTKGRYHGGLAVLGPGGEVTETVQLNAKPLMDELHERIPKLNLEGTAVTGDVFRILQRGNDPEAYNAHIDLDLEGLLTSLASSPTLGPDLIRDIRRHDLGRIGGIDLCFSDADTLPDERVVFCASAEASGEGIDGQVGGSALGLMEPNGDVVRIEPLDVKTKVEGLAARLDDRGIHAYMVSDEDDPGTPSVLLRATIPPSDV